MPIKVSPRLQTYRKGMIPLYKMGMTLQDIGDTYGVTREYVRQVIAGAGVSWKEGGKAVQKAQSAERMAAVKDARCIARWGHSAEAHRHLINLGKAMMAKGASRERTPIGAWNVARGRARLRGSELSANLAQWWASQTAEKAAA